MRIPVLLLGVAMLTLPGLAPAPVAAQSTNLDGRVNRLESEMRAVQRKVFPNGGGQLLQPQVTAPTQPVEAPGTPAAGALVDLSARVTSLEEQIASLTGQTEQNGYQLRQLREQFEAYQRATDAKLAAMGPPPATAPATGSGGMGGGDDPAPIAPAKSSGPPPKGAPEASTAKPADPGRAARVAAVPRPKSADPAEDAYLYGFRLWEAKFYPEAQAQLKKTVNDYPKSKRASYAQNLLGRAYLDDGKPSLASIAFYENYKKMPDGDRAPDSLLYLGEALTRLDKPADACKVYDELSDVYVGKIAGMKADIAKGRAAAKCK